MTLGTVLLIVLIFMLIGSLPTWGYSRGWGYTPIGTILVVFIILYLLGFIR